MANDETGRQIEFLAISIVDQLMALQKPADGMIALVMALVIINQIQTGTHTRAELIDKVSKMLRDAEVDVVVSEHNHETNVLQ